MVKLYQNEFLLRELLLKHNLSYTQVSKEIKCNRRTLMTWCEKFNISRDLSLKHEKISNDTKDKITEMYLSGNSLKEISNEYNLSNFVLSKILKEKNVSKRTMVEVTSNTREKHGIYRKYSVDESYFETVSGNTAYILGFLSADGYITQDFIRICLQERDSYILDFIKKELKYEGVVKKEIYRCNGKEYDTATLCIYSQKISRDLLHFNLHNNKSLNLELPCDKIDKKYWPDFIRGFFDGDGSVKVFKSNKGTSTQITTRFSSASYHCITDLEYMLITLGIYRTSFRETILKSGNTFYEITISTKQSEMLYDILYYSDEIMYLKRKKEKFDNGLKLRS